MYAPLAIKQKPVKNRNTNAPGIREAAAMPHAATGNKTPNIGPAHTTSNGAGLAARSVREIVNGYKTTCLTVPPETKAPRT